MKIAMIYTRFMTPDGSDRTIGGIQTYLFNLGRVFARYHYEPVIYQYATSDFKVRVEDITIVGVPVNGFTANANKRKLVYSAIADIDIRNDLVIFGSDGFSMKIDGNRCVSIQHGIEWDLPQKYAHKNSRLRRFSNESFYQLVRRRRAIRSFLKCPNRVCVDYNFLNWFRTYLNDDLPGRNWVILNPTRISLKDDLENRKKSCMPIRILFARRFETYRGTRIMAKTVKKLLNRYDQIQFTFAGEGPDEMWLKEYFRDENKVIFTKYLSHQTLDIHLQHDIAVIPSIASEGSSFSVAEAMGAGCAVVATAVGGITNMIIHGYNGLLCSPTVDDLYEQLERLINDNELRLSIGVRGYETAEEALSFDRWEESWIKVVNEVAEES